MNMKLYSKQIINNAYLDKKINNALQAIKLKNNLLNK